MSSVVHVSGISSSTSEKDIRDFFSFCGKISDLKIEDDSKTEAGPTKKATVTFEKETAAKTALLLDSTQLGPAQIHVTSGISSTSTSAAAGEHEHDDVPQEEKPRSRIFAEYLAHGYVISDKAIERALALDQQHGVSQKFTSYLTSFDQKYKVTEKAKAGDERYGVSARANAAWGGLASYFEKAANTPTGQKLRQFYEQGNKQVLDVHNEARHLANLKGGKSEPVPTESGDRTTCNCGASTGKCGCAPGTCACASCAKNPDEKAAPANVQPAGTEKAGDATAATTSST
jgi:RNA recognition motif-containing protein